jgi:hypothetical protein
MKSIVHGKIYVPPSSSLIFGEADGGIEFHAHGFDVEGNIVAGSKNCEINKKIGLTISSFQRKDITIPQNDGFPQC